MLIALPSFVFAESDVLPQLDRNKYSSFKTIESFKIIKCIFRGNGAEKNGLIKEDLTDFIRLKFENKTSNYINPDAMNSFNSLSVAIGRIP